MKLPWKIVVPLICLGALSVTAIAWHVHGVRAADRKRTADVAACQAAAERGDPKAEARLGSMYSYGNGIPQDDTKAAHWYRKSAEQGNAEGEYGLAWSYYHGRGISHDYSQAFAWFRKAADQDLSRAENGLGNMYAEGNGVPEDDAEAVRWYRKAADHRYPAGEYNLGIMDYFGKGLPENHAEGRRLFRQAAADGDVYALRSISTPLGWPAKFAVLLRTLVGLYLVLSFVPFNYLDQRKSLRDFRQRVKIATGVAFLFTAGFIWYGYTHCQFRCPGYGITAYGVTRWLLDALLVIPVVYLVRTPARTAEAESLDVVSTSS